MNPESVNVYLGGGVILIFWESNFYLILMIQKVKKRKFFFNHKNSLKLPKYILGSTSDLWIILGIQRDHV